MRVLGIDPGLRACGWGVIDVDGPRLGFVACGTVRPPVDGQLAARLRALHDALAAIVACHAPDEAAVEETFVNANPRSALTLGQARGIALLVPALAGIAIGEYAANMVKKTVVGVGHAGKAQVGHMVKMQLPASNPDSEDAADALAVALCHGVHAQTARRLAGAAR